MLNQQVKSVEALGGTFPMLWLLQRKYNITWRPFKYLHPVQLNGSLLRHPDNLIGDIQSGKPIRDFSFAQRFLKLEVLGYVPTVWQRRGQDASETTPVTSAIFNVEPIV